MKTEKGNRKLAVNRETGGFLILGLFISLLAAGYFKMDTAVCVQGYGIFVAGLIGKDTAFMWSNAREHAATQPKPN